MRAGGQLFGRGRLERVLEDVAGERRPHVAERQLGERASAARGVSAGAAHDSCDDAVAGLFAERAGKEPDCADEAALVEELLEILGRRVVAFAPAGLQRLGHALQQLLPGRDSDSRTNDQGRFARTDLLDEGLGDRVLLHPKPRSCERNVMKFAPATYRGLRRAASENRAWIEASRRASRRGSAGPLAGLARPSRAVGVVASGCLPGFRSTCGSDASSPLRSS